MSVLVEVLVDLVEPERHVDLVPHVAGGERHRHTDPLDQVVVHHVADDLERRSGVPLLLHRVGALNRVERRVDEANDVVHESLVIAAVERELTATGVVGVDGVDVAGLHAPAAADAVLDQLFVRPASKHLAHDGVVGLHLHGNVVEIEGLEVVRDRDRHRHWDDDVIVLVEQLHGDRVMECHARSPGPVVERGGVNHERSAAESLRECLDDRGLLGLE